MALVTIFAILTLVFAFRRKEWFLTIIAVITGLMLATTGTDIGTKAVEILTSVSQTIDGLFK
ncbi:hypothetical protein [Actinophytocola sp.]|uniref:hypothetical protein n=1 Tax=Actinophytocola sp. TaxID=1872138 RepID=UPI002D7F8C3C|nr:hypothetical protein [Actinophytocola sp.]HET9144048.1 hypothetical protein [Actinophytocola sp.]